MKELFNYSYHVCIYYNGFDSNLQACFIITNMIIDMKHTAAANVPYLYSSINMFKNRIDNYLVRTGYMWTLDKPMASLSAVIFGLDI